MDIKKLPCWAKMAIVVGLIAFILNWPTSSSEWAAWVQAVGTIGAIVGAVYIAKREERTRRKEAKDEASRKDRILVNGMYSVAKDAFFHLKRFESSANRSHNFRDAEDRDGRVVLWKLQGKIDLGQAIDLLNDIPLYQCPDSALITGIAFFKSNLVALQSEIEEAVLRAMEDPNYNFPIHHFLDYRLEHANKIWDQLSEAVEEYYASNTPVVMSE